MENISETVLSVRLETTGDICTDVKWQLLCIRNSVDAVSDNQNAITLYEKLGFQKYGTFPDNMKYADEHYASADWMMKKL